MLKPISSINLRVIQAESPTAHIVSVEPRGGGANLFGPYPVEELEAIRREISDRYAEDENIYTYGIDKAVEEFCDPTEEEDTLSTLLEDEYKAAIANDGPVLEADNGVEFENWIETGVGFCEYNGVSYAKSDDTGDTEVYIRDDETHMWTQHS